MSNAARKPPQLGRALCIRRTKDRKYYVYLYDSGIQHYELNGPRPPTKTPRVYLERHVPKQKLRQKDRCNRRRKWCLVERVYGTPSWVARFAPILAGPFENLQIALVAWELMR